jgi:hypothetical protein
MFETMSNLNMWDETALIFMTDHGHYLGEHNYTGKPNCPCYNIMVNLPFMIYLPGETGNRHINALTANVDVYPTILDLFGLKPQQPVHGHSILPLIRNQVNKIKEAALYGYFGRFANITDGSFTYMRYPQNPETELNIYSMRWNFGRYSGVPPLNNKIDFGYFMPNINMPVGKMSIPPNQMLNGCYEPNSHLYNIDKDPDQNNNLAGSKKEKQYADLLKQELQKVHCPKEQFNRLGL